MNQHPHLGIGQEVTFVGEDKKTHKGKITEVVNGDTARIEFENGGAAVAPFGDEPGTFHFEQASPKEEPKKHEAHNQHKKE